MIEKFKDERILKKILLIFLAIQPFLDCYLLYTDDVIGFFHFSPTTIIRFLIVGILFLLVFFNKNNKNNRKYVFIYGGIVVVYTILHCITTMNYNTDSYPTFTFGFVTEIFYVLRMLLPLLVLYITYTLKVSRDEFIKLIFTVALFSSMIIVVMNFLNISLTSYGGNNIIQGTFFSWFSEERPSSNWLASKGWFNSANQISGLFSLLLPVLIYGLFNKFSYKKVIVVSLTIFAMIMLGTRTSTIGWILISAMMIIIYLFFCFIKKQKFNKKPFFAFLIIIAFSVCLFTFSPLVNTGGTSADQEQAKLEQYLKNKKIDMSKLTLKEYLGFLGVNEEYYKSLYPFKEHKDFWHNVAYDVPYYDRVGNRNTQALISEDINNTFKTSLSPVFGLSYSRFINAKIYLEEDFTVHYYTVGVLGIGLFLIPYIFIILFKFYQMIFVDRKMFKFYNITLLAACALPLAISVITGHIVDELIVSFYMGGIAGFILLEIKPDKNKKTLKTD